MLVEQLISSPGKLSLIHAPAGFGKTSLLAEVREKLEQRGVPVGYSMVETGESSSATWYLLDEPDLASLRQTLPSLMADVSRARGGIIIATRHIDKLPVARLRADGLAVRYGPHHIGVSARDAAILLKHAIDKKRADWLAGMVEGWSVAIGFLVDYARNPKARFDQGGNFLGASGLSAYIEQELLGELPDEWADALCFASLVSTCDKAMLDAIRPDDDLGRHLASLQVCLPGLVEDQSGEIRLNPLLRLHLLKRFEQRPKAERADALERASQACLRVGRTAEAASLITRVGDPGAIVAFVRRSQGLRLWVTAGFDVIREIVAQAGTRGLEDEPRLKLLKCMVLVKDGEIGEGERLFGEVLPLLAGDDEALQDADVIRTTLQIYGCRNFTHTDLAKFRRYILRNNDDPAWKTLILSMQCILSIQRGDLDEGAVSIVEAAKQSRAAGTDYALLFLDIHATNAALARGDLQRARALLGQARKVWRQKFSNDVGVQTMLDALTASLEFEAGRLSSARVHIRRSTHNMPHVEAWLDIYAAAYEPMARLLVIDIGLPATLASLQAQREALDTSGLPRIARLVTALEICLRGELMLHNKLDLGPLSVPAIEEGSQLQSWQERELFGMAQAYAHLAERQAELAIRALTEVLEFADPRKLLRTSLRARLLLVAAYENAGDPDAADRLFEEALHLGERTGLSRAFAEVGGPPVWGRIMDRVAKLPVDEFADPRRVRLLRLVARWDEASAQPHSTRFTPRESDVLAALERGGVDKQIGRRLGITEHAVRYHLKNIFKKLGVHDRVGALARARDVGALN